MGASATVYPELAEGLSLRASATVYPELADGLSLTQGFLIKTLLYFPFFTTHSLFLEIDQYDGVENV
jgi:hypothetical protein